MCGCGDEGGEDVRVWECEGVVEWEESGKGLHCMRDHPLVRSEYLLLVG